MSSYCSDAVWGVRGKQHVGKHEQCVDSKCAHGTKLSIVGRSHHRPDSSTRQQIPRTNNQQSQELRLCVHCVQFTSGTAVTPEDFPLHHHKEWHSHDLHLCYSTLIHCSNCLAKWNILVWGQIHPKGHCIIQYWSSRKEIPQSLQISISLTLP